MEMLHQKKTPLLSVKNLRKTYKGFQLENVNLTLNQGMIMGFMGRNGAGKTTTMEAIMDLIVPDAGDIDIFGLKMKENEISIKDQVGYVSDTPILNSGWTVNRTLDFIRPFYSTWNGVLERNYLKQFQIPTDKKIAKLSKGMKVKFSLLLAICHQPKLLLLDEVTSGLDPVVREEVLKLLLDYMQDESCGVLFSSHITLDVEKIADVVTIIDDGKVLLSKEKDALLDRWRRIIIFGEGASEIKKDSRLMRTTATQGGYVGYTDDFETFANAHQNSGAWQDERMNLEELFIFLTDKEG